MKELRGKVRHQSLFIDQLLEQIKLARHQRFGERSEHCSPDQFRLLLDDAITQDMPVDNDADDIDDDPLNQSDQKKTRSTQIAQSSAPC